jgi:hypothetical protein
MSEGDLRDVQSRRWLSGCLSSFSRLIYQSSEVDQPNLPIVFFLGLQCVSLLLSSLLASRAEKFTASRPVQPTEKLSAVIALPDGFSPA